MKQLFAGLILLIVAASVNAQTAPVLLSKFVVQNKPTSVVAYWTTTAESNNNHFTLYGSNDGINFVALGQVPSYVASGNSGIAHDYTLTVNYTKEAGFGLLFAVVLISIAIGMVKRNKVAVLSLGVVALLSGSIISCSKSSSSTTAYSRYSIFKLGQTDNDGTTTYYFPTN